MRRRIAEYIIIILIKVKNKEAPESSTNNYLCLSYPVEGVVGILRGKGILLIGS
jgi:hypothetical protein